jgi:hypothetical protein
MKTDLEKAREIVSRRGPFVGNSATTRENVTKAVAEGIALGRAEGRAEGLALVARGATVVDAKIAELERAR